MSLQSSKFGGQNTPRSVLSEKRTQQADSLRSALRPFCRVSKQVTPSVPFDHAAGTKHIPFAESSSHAAASASGLHPQYPPLILQAQKGESLRSTLLSCCRVSKQSPFAVPFFPRQDCIKSVRNSHRIKRGNLLAH